MWWARAHNPLSDVWSAREANCRPAVAGQPVLPCVAQHRIWASTIISSRWSHGTTRADSLVARRWPCISVAVRLHAGACARNYQQVHVIRPLELLNAHNRRCTALGCRGVIGSCKLSGCQVVALPIRTVPGGPGRSRAARSVPGPANAAPRGGHEAPNIPGPPPSNDQQQLGGLGTPPSNYLQPLGGRTPP